MNDERAVRAAEKIARISAGRINGELRVWEVADWIASSYSDVLAENERLKADKMGLLRGSTGDIKVLMHLRKKIVELEQENERLTNAIVNCDSVCVKGGDFYDHGWVKAAEVNKERHDLQERLKEESDRLQYVIDHHVKSHSPHMDGTYGWSFRGLMNGLYRTAREAIDAARSHNV